MVAIGPLSWNSEITAVAGDVITARFGGGWDNYRWSGVWSRINPTFAADGASWLHDESPWSIRCPRYADERIVLVDENEYDPHQRSTRSPGDWPILEMDHPDASGQVEGVVDDSDPSRVVYADALGDGVDIVAGLWYGYGTRYPRPEHLVRVRTLPAGDADAVIRERIYTPLSIPGWNGSRREIGATGAVLLTANGDAGIVMLPAYAWYRGDAGQGELVRIPISVTAERMSGYTLITKTIPRWFIEAALAAGAYVLADETTSTYYPDANVEVTSVDGYAARSASPSESFATIISGAGTTFNDQQSQPTPLFLSADSTPNRYLLLRRAFTLFDTSAIGATNVVSSGSYGIYGISKNITLQPTEVCLVSTNPASNTAIASSDFSRVGSTELATRKTGASWSTTGYNVFTLNSSGIANVNTSGISKFGMRLGCDLDGVEVTWVGLTQTNYQVYFAENGTNKPYLTVTYAPALRVAPLVRGRSRVLGGGVL